MQTAWLLLIVAGLMEPCWVYTLESSEHFRRKGYAVATVVIIATDLWMLAQVMPVIGAGTSYAVWAGIGAVTTFAMGVVLYKEPLSLRRSAFIALIVAGIVGLHALQGVAR